MWKKIGYLALFVIFISGCEPKTNETASGKFGMMSTETPEYTAMLFFQHIYQDKTLDAALALSTPKMSRLLKSYHTNKSVQKHILNMRFDHVEIQPSTRSAGRTEFADEATISLFFEGTLNDDNLKDMRNVELVKVKNKWKVDSVSM